MSASAGSCQSIRGRRRMPTFFKAGTRGVVAGIIDGTRQVLFLMIPMALYLMVFSTPLVTLYHIGAFTADAIGQIASYLAVMAVALPFYGVNAYLGRTSRRGPPGRRQPRRRRRGRHCRPWARSRA